MDFYFFICCWAIALFQLDDICIFLVLVVVSEMRKDDPGLAYFGCHTDITIPYDELGSIRTVDDEGEMTSIIEDGRFVLPGTEGLNEPFEEQ